MFKSPLSDQPVPLYSSVNATAPVVLPPNANPAELLDPAPQPFCRAVPKGEVADHAADAMCDATVPLVEL